MQLRLEILKLSDEDGEALGQPEYRARLFLSADLAGSTAFKSDPDNQNWAREFKKFYSAFLGQFSSNYLQICEKYTDECESFNTQAPKLWKTVGDEVIFVNRVDSYMQIFAYVTAFIDTLKDYRIVLEKINSKTKMDVKGNGWIGSFPHPNQTFELSTSGADDDDSLPNEKLESAADLEPSRYDFLGKGIDYGFRIGKNSRTDFFTVSPALASILCLANNNHAISPFKFKLKFKGMNCLKGVLNGQDYPIFGINTEFNDTRNKLAELQKALGGGSEPSPKALEVYLDEYIEFHGIEKPSLKIQAKDDRKPDPEYFNEFSVRWIKQKEGLKQTIAEEVTSAETEDGDLDSKTVKEKIDSLEGQLTQTK